MDTMDSLSQAGLLAIERDCQGNPGRAARGIARRAVSAILASAGDTTVSVACDLDGSPLLLADPQLGEQAATLVYPAEPDLPGAALALTLQGMLQPMKEVPGLGRYIARFCNRHVRPPESLPDGGLALFRLDVSSAKLSADGEPAPTLTGADYLLDFGDAPDHTQKEWDNLAHQNYQHLDINEQLVTQLLGLPRGRWVLTGLDPEGMDFRLGGYHCRLPFPEVLLTYKAMGSAIKTYLIEARTRLGIATDSLK